MSIRVLLADDHALLREGLKGLLEAMGDMEIVAEAGNGLEAIERAEASKPDVVLMDIAMPRLNGIEATRVLHQALPGTRVVILSMVADAEYVHRALQAGAVGYVLKEAVTKEVIAAVRAAHAGKRYLSAPVADMARTAAHAGRSPVESLSVRERQVLQLVVEGRSSAEIARVMNLSPSSVDTYRSRLMKKLGVADVPALVRFALAHGITPPR